MSDTELKECPVPDPETLSIIYLFYLSFASNFNILDVAPLTYSLTGLPKKHMHNSLNTKIPFFMAFFSYVKTYHNGLGRPPRHGFIKTTFSIAENRVFDCHNDIIVECNYSVIDRQYETV